MKGNTMTQEDRIMSQAIYNACHDCMPMAQKEYEETGESGSIDVLENWMKISRAKLNGEEIPTKELKRPVIASKEVTKAFKNAVVKHRMLLTSIN